MPVALRYALSVPAGLLVSFILVIAVEGFGAVTHPFPEGFQGTQEEMCAHVAKFPAWVLAASVPMWGVAAFAGTWVAGCVGWRIPAVILGVLLLAAVLFNVSMLPYPWWFSVSSPLVVLGACVFAVKLTRRSRAATTANVID